MCHVTNENTTWHVIEFKSGQLIAKKPMAISFICSICKTPFSPKSLLFSVVPKSMNPKNQPQNQEKLKKVSNSKDCWELKQFGKREAYCPILQLDNTFVKKVMEKETNCDSYDKDDIVSEHYNILLLWNLFDHQTSCSNTAMLDNIIISCFPAPMT